MTIMEQKQEQIWRSAFKRYAYVLRNTTKVQIRGYYCDMRDNKKMCAVGAMMAADGWNGLDSVSGYIERIRVGLGDRTAHIIQHMNDVDKYTFSQIADWLDSLE